MTQMIPFNQAPLPAFLQQAAGAANINQLAATGTGGSAVDSISIEGGRFSIFKGGTKVQTLEQLSMQVVIVHANPGITKVYYAGAWNPAQDAAPPDCSSDDGVTPRADIAVPQCGTCAACPQNQFGSKINLQTQKQSKACTDKKSLAVVPPSDVAGDLYRFQVPAASLGDFGAFLRGLPNVPYYGVICKISFDTQATFPKVKFEAIGYVSAEQYAVISERHNSAEAKAIAGVAGSTVLRTVPAHLQQPAQQQQIPVQQVYGAAVPNNGAPAGTVVEQQRYAEPVQAQAQQQVQQPVQQQQTHVQQAAPLSQTPAAQDPNVAAIFGGQGFGQPAGTATAQAGFTPNQNSAPASAQGNFHPSGREYGKPPAGKKRRTKAEMAEDAAVGIGADPNEQSEEDDNQAAQQHVQQQQVQQQQVQQQVNTGFGGGAVETQQMATGFGQPVQQQQQVYQQPANQPQVIQDSAVAGAFAGWDD